MSRLLREHGFSFMHQRGSHLIYRRQLPAGDSATVPVPNRREIPVGTLKSIIAPRRRLHRKLLRVLGKRTLHELDLREYAAARPPEDAVGRWQSPPAQPRREIGFHAIGKEAADGGKARSKQQLKP